MGVEIGILEKPTLKKRAFQLILGKDVPKYHLIKEAEDKAKAEAKAKAKAKPRAKLIVDKDSKSSRKARKEEEKRKKKEEKRKAKEENQRKKEEAKKERRNREKAEEVEVKENLKGEFVFDVGGQKDELKDSDAHSDAQNDEFVDAGERASFLFVL